MEKSKKTKSIMHILPSLESGGVEREVIALCKLATKNGYKCYVISAGGAMEWQVLQAQAEHIKIDIGSKNPFKMIANIFKLRKLIQNLGIDIVHAHSRAPAWVAYFAKNKFSSHIFVTSVHATYSINSSYFKKLYNSVMIFSDHVIAVSNFVKNYLIDNYNMQDKSINVIHCGVDVEYFNFANIEKNRVAALCDKLKIPTDKPIILMPARLSRLKAQDVLIDAVSLLEKDSVTCLIVGKEKKGSNYREFLQDKIRKLNLFSRIFICKPISDMAPLYALSDIVVSIKKEPESFGLVAVEGQSMGKCVIASKLGGHCETVIDKKTGWLISPDDAIALKNAIEKIISLSDEERLGFGEAARSHVEKNFSQDNRDKKMLKFYQEVLKESDD